ncbi:CPBP family intramembrane glutamic endopeptidase [Nocardia sp. XZ_19_369]|uniref:CPBP family intramembrane glutamic endopeptidase n=1 Tax=Nocardia sp. XZ_19_369 TaxID=2769487 RepID=UPI00188FAAE0|nr:CPBP family intramembrane glutamic endopeptidase [Nocardia sp. XZ_19_369]
MELRKSWSSRVLAHPLTRLLVGVIVVLAAVKAADLLTTPLAGSDVGRPIRAVFQVACAYGAYYVVIARLIEHRHTAGEISPRIGHGMAGIALGSIGAFAVVGSISWLGSVHLVRAGDVGSTLLVTSAMAISSGFIEELLLRGLVFRLLEEWFGSWIALILSAGVFGALHLGNDHASLWSATAIALEAGLSLAILFMVTRNLWLAIGVHLAWNFWQGFLGVPVSGTATTGYLRTELDGPTWVTGGAFGYEASAITVAYWLGIAVAFLVVAVRRRRIRPRPSRRVAQSHTAAPGSAPLSESS